MTFYKIKLILHFILLSLWEGSDFRLMINQPSVGIIDANILFLWFVPYAHKPKTIKDYLKSQGIINKKIVTRHEIMEALVMKFTLGYLAFMSILILILGMFGSHQRDAMTDYSTINWEYTRP